MFVQLKCEFCLLSERTCMEQISVCVLCVVLIPDTFSRWMMIELPSSVYFCVCV